MPTPRFFIDEPTLAFHVGERFKLPEKTARHAGRSLRLAAGERVELFNGSGTAWQGAIAFSDDAAWVEIDAKTERASESPLSVKLVQSLVAPDKTDWIVEKAVEAGVAEIIFVPAERSVTRLSGDRLAKRLLRLREIARSAAEQCGRNFVPPVRAAASLSDGLNQTKAELRFVLAPGAEAAGNGLARMQPGLASIALAVGPEGGFSAKEIKLAQDSGWEPLLIGPRVLRTETAGLAAAIWAQTLAGDFPRKPNH